jgi:serine-type D-Ala-D-Ala carboxypeptidase/endopeptidase
VDPVVQEYLRLHPEAGLAVGVIDRDTSYTLGYGTVSRYSRSAPDGRTIFEIGSVTKTFTALMLAGLAARGSLKLDDPVENFLPRSVRVPSLAGVKITTRHLLTHTSGLPRDPDNYTPGSNPFLGYSRQSLFNFLNSCVLTRAPGTFLEYSNLGFALLGVQIESLTQQDYESALQSLVCRPLGLRDTGTRLGSERLKRYAKGHTASGVEIEPWEFGAMVSCGGIGSTAEDMVTYMRAQMGQGAGGLEAAIDSCHTENFRFNWIVIGLSWYLRGADGQPVILHNGRTGGYSSMLLFSPAERRGVVVLSSSFNLVDDIAVRIYTALSGGASTALTGAGMSVADGYSAPLRSSGLSENQR